MSVWRDTTPAVGRPAGPAFGERTGEKVDLHIGLWKDGRWSYLYGEDTEYGGEMPDLEAVREAPKRARDGPLPDQVEGPVIKPPVWTWEVPLYFWFGGIAAGLVVRGAGLRPRRRRASRPRWRASSRSARWRRRRCC